MGQAIRTTKLPLNLEKRTYGGVNTGKRASPKATVQVLNAARAFYVAFFLAHRDKLRERVVFFSEKHQAKRERLISAHELLTWAEFQTVATNVLWCARIIWSKSWHVASSSSETCRACP